MKKTTFVALQTFVLLTGSTAQGAWELDAESILETAQKDQLIELTCEDDDGVPKNITIKLPNSKEYQLYDASVIGNHILVGNIAQVV